jgi:hypothetical protein
LDYAVLGLLLKLETTTRKTQDHNPKHSRLAAAEKHEHKTRYDSKTTHLSVKTTFIIKLSLCYKKTFQQPKVEYNKEKLVQ